MDLQTLGNHVIWSEGSKTLQVASAIYIQASDRKNHFLQLAEDCGVDFLCDVQMEVYSILTLLIENSFRNQPSKVQTVQ